MSHPHLPLPATLRVPSPSTAFPSRKPARRSASRLPPQRALLSPPRPRGALLSPLLSSALPLLLLLLTSLSCAGAPRRVSFDPAAYAPYAQGGTSVVEGRASVEDDTGAWHTAAGREIRLQPVTPYAEEWFNRVVLGEEELEPEDPALGAFVHTEVADDSGAFRFTRLAPGEYFLTCRISWVTPGLQNRLISSGAWAHARISVPADTTLNLLLGR